MAPAAAATGASSSSAIAAKSAKRATAPIKAIVPTGESRAAAPPKNNTAAAAATTTTTTLRDAAGLLDAEEQGAVAAMDTLTACLPGSTGNQVRDRGRGGPGSQLRQVDLITSLFICPFQFQEAYIVQVL